MRLFSFGKRKRKSSKKKQTWGNKGWTFEWTEKGKKKKKLHKTQDSAMKHMKKLKKKGTKYTIKHHNWDF